jgi:acid phosphatase class B
MKIGIDIDDTLTSFSDIYYSELQKWLLKKGIIKYNDNIFSKYVKDIKFDFKQFWKEVMLDIALNIECKNGASEIINKLLKEGHEVYIITARSNNFFDGYIEKTKKWLDKRNINYTDSYFNANDKVDIMRFLKLDVMVDDNKQVMDSAVDLNINGIIMNTMFNADYNKCDRAYTWYDVYYYINEMKKNLTQS